MDFNIEEGGDERYGITAMSGSDLNAHDSFDRAKRDSSEDDETFDADTENDPLMKSEDTSEEEEKADDGKIFGISKSLIPFYGVYKLITKAGPYPLVVLMLLLLAYLHNQLVRYTLSITAAEVAGDLHYGNKSCAVNRHVLDNITSSYPNNVSSVSLAKWTSACGASSRE